MRNGSEAKRERQTRAFNRLQRQIVGMEIGTYKPERFSKVSVETLQRLIDSRTKELFSLGEKLGIEIH
jgi:hypothetical protein